MRAGAGGIIGPRSESLKLASSAAKLRDFPGEEHRGPKGHPANWTNARNYEKILRVLCANLLERPFARDNTLLISANDEW